MGVKSSVRTSAMQPPAPKMSTVNKYNNIHVHQNIVYTDLLSGIQSIKNIFFLNPMEEKGSQ